MSEQNRPREITEAVHTLVMIAQSTSLTLGEFASLLSVGQIPSVFRPPVVIPADHSARLIERGYMVHLQGRLRMTTPGRMRMRAGRLGGKKKGLSVVV